MESPSPWIHRFLLAAALSLVSAGCGDDQAISTNPELTAEESHTRSGVSGVDGPVMRHLEPVSNEGEDAEIGGVVAVQDGCLFLEGDDGYQPDSESDSDSNSKPGTLVIWPHETRWDDKSAAVILPNGDRVEPGDSVAGGGGYYSLDRVEAAAGAKAAILAVRCRGLRPDGGVAIVNNQGDAVERSGPVNDAPEAQSTQSSALTVEPGASLGSPQTDPEPGEVKLWISNQSFDDDPVDVTVTMAGETVVSESFEVKGQHNWIAFDITGLEPGIHTVEASSSTGVEFSGEFTLPEGEPRWLVLDYWYYTDDDLGRYFTFAESDIPVGFD